MRVGATQARGLGIHLGWELPSDQTDFSLAEIYAGLGSVVIIPTHPRLGFAA